MLGLLPASREGRTTSVGLFLFGLMAFGYFHPGGGWNQNSRFALVRSLVEERRAAIDSFLVYVREGEALRRIPVQNGTIVRAGTTEVLTWAGPDKRQVPIAPDAPAAAPRVVADQIAASGDLSFHAGHFHPNKAPGTSLAAVPAYAVLYGLERAVGIDTDTWRVLTTNAWLCSLLSVGAVSAAGLVLFHALARVLSRSRRAALLATVGFGLGTLYWPYATGLREHNLIAVLLLLSYAAIRAVPDAPEARRRLLACALAGAAGGAAIVVNYVDLVAVALLAAYLLWTMRRARPALPLVAFAAGAALPLGVLAAYNLACFGRVLTTNYAYENLMFVSARPALLGVLDWPRPALALMLTMSPFRGLVFSSPVLVLGVIGLVRLFKEPAWRADAALFLGLVSFFFVFNCSFNGWHGGWASGPRYLLPAFPFLALPMVRVFERAGRLPIGVLIVSIAINCLAVAVDPECPIGTAGHGYKPGVPQWMHSPLLDYQWPLFTQGRAEPVLRAQRDALVARVGERWRQEGRPPEAIRAGLEEVRADIDAAMDRGEDNPTALASVHGYVSVNPMGMYEAWYFRLFPRGSREAEGNAFNLGETVLPGSRLSLVPLLAALAWGIGRLLARETDPAAPVLSPADTSKRRKKRRAQA